MKRNMKCALTWVSAVLMLLLTLAPVLAVNATIPAPTADQVASFNQVLQPVWMIYNLVKYIATAIALVVLLFAGIKYMMSGSNAADRDNAKNMVAYVIIGLLVIWVAPYVVQLFTS